MGSTDSPLEVGGEGTGPSSPSASDPLLSAEDFTLEDEASYVETVDPEEEQPLKSPFKQAASASARMPAIAPSTPVEEASEEELEPQMTAPLGPPPSLPQQIIRRITDVILITKLAARLWTYVARGWTWFFNFSRLVLFAAILFPGFAQMIVFYFFSPRLLRSVPFGAEARNRVDIFVPRKRWRRLGPRPVVIFITGGAWTIGYKAWGALLGRRLSQRGLLVFSLDYRNFPQGTVLDMLCDVNTGISWALQNASLYGGDSSCVYLVGQSAGAHLGALCLFAQCQRLEGEAGVGRGGAGELKARAGGLKGGMGELRAAPGETLDKALSPAFLGGAPAWDPARVRGFVGVSGAYDLAALKEHLDARGLNKRMLGHIMSVDGRPALRRLSPTRVVEGLGPAAAARVPPCLLLHGTADKTVPSTNARGMAAALHAARVPTQLKLYAGKTHTQPIVEDPMRGGRDELMDDVLALVTGQPQRSSQFPMLPSWLINLATAVCPF